jgi:adhesin/invasin
VTFATDLGTLSAASAITNAGGQASVSLTGSTAGSATVTARAASGSTGSVVVTLTSAAPVITGFSEQGKSYNGGFMTNVVVINTDSAFWYETRWTWSATGADRYELIDPWGSVLYSGTGTSLTWAYMTWIPNNVWLKMQIPGDERTRLNYTLKAYKGSNVTTQTLGIQHSTVYCNGCGA